MRGAIASAINTLGSTITITSYTISSSDSGYSGQTETETDGDSVSETAAPFAEFKKMLKQKFGDLESGQFQLALKSTATISINDTTKYKAIWQDETYDIIKYEPYHLNDVLIAYIATLGKRFN